MYKKKPRNETPSCSHCSPLLLYPICLTHPLVDRIRWLCGRSEATTHLFPLRHASYAGSRVFSSRAKPSLTSGRPYALRGLGMPVCNHQSRFCRQARWMCSAGGAQDEAQAMAGGDMLYLLPGLIGGGGYVWQYVRNPVASITLTDSKDNKQYHNTYIIPLLVNGILVALYEVCSNQTCTKPLLMFNRVKIRGISLL